MQDYELLEQIKAANQQSFEELYRRYWRPLYRFALRLTQSPDEAKDLVQDIFVNLWHKRQELLITSSVSNYLYKSLHHLFLDQVRKQASHEKYIRTLSAAYFQRNETEEQLLADELEKTIAAEITKLPHRCQEVFRLSRYEHLSIEQIADRLHLSPQTVKNQLSIALQTLRTVLKEQAGLLILLLSIK